jgi:hypothetical protein
VPENSSIAKKLQLVKPNQSALILNAPAGYLDNLTPLLPEGVAVATNTNTTPDATNSNTITANHFDFVQAFVKNKAALEVILPLVLQASNSTSLVWLAYPKGGKKKAGTDLNRDILWEAVSKYGLVGVSLISLDEVWSAMRFRPAESVKQK